jgi:DNA-binding transcriptional LysR family regulator
MELRQLQHFIAVAEELSFTRAAERLNIVQSSVSSSIRVLEDELRAPLLVRSTRQVQLTPAGRAFLDRALRVVEMIGDGREAVADITGLRRGSLAIGTVHTLAAFLDLPSLIERFHLASPGIEVRMRQGETQDLLELLRTGKLDLAFLPLLHPPDDIVARVVACEDLVVATAADHPLAGRKDVRLNELVAYPFVDFEVGWGTRPLIDQAFREKRLDRRTSFDLTDLDTVLDLIRRNLGIGLLPETIVHARQPAIAAAELAGEPICWELVVAYLRAEGEHHVNGAAGAFMNLLRFVEN